MTEGIDAASRAEAGNIKYDYYTPVDGDDELLLVEKWRDADALKAHSAQPHFARLGEIKAEFVLDTVIERKRKLYQRIDIENEIRPGNPA